MLFWGYNTTILYNSIHNATIGVFMDSLDNYSKMMYNSINNNTQKQIYSLNIRQELSYDRRGNYWGRSTPPYFIPGVDSNNISVIDSCPYNQSYAPGQWPASPVCPASQCEQQGGVCLASCQYPYQQINLSCNSTQPTEERISIQKAESKNIFEKIASFLTGKAVFQEIERIFSKEELKPINQQVNQTVCCIDIRKPYPPVTAEAIKEV
jgi:hypothetical protein